MMEKIIKVLVCIVVVVLASFVQNLINTRKNNRARQGIFPWLAMLYSAVVILLACRYFDIIHLIINLFGDYLYDSSVALLNGILLIGFIVIKAVLCPTITRLFRKKEYIEVSMGMFYHYDDEYEEWFLKHEWTNFRKYLFAISCALAGITGAYVGLVWVFGEKSWIWNVAFPAAAVIVFNEIYSLINGQTKEEYEHSVLGDAADVRRISNYYKVREVLEKILPEPLLSAHTGYEYAGKQTPADLIDEWKSTGDKIDKVTAEYFEIDNRYQRADIDCVQATSQLMHRNNVVFFNPFYRDMSLYIILPLVQALLRGKRCVVITGRLSNRQDVKDWLGDVLHKYSHMKYLWRVGILGNREPDCEVGILSFPQLYDDSVIAVNREFLRETDFVFLIEPSLIVNTGQVALSIIAQEMRANGEEPVYCICDRNTEGLVDTLSHVLRANIVDVVAPPVPRCIYTGMSWDADGDFIRQQLFDKQTRYLGNGIELAAIAVKNQIPHVSWYCETKAPIKDIKWIAGQQHTTICKYMNIPAQQKNLYEKIEFVSNIWNTSAEKEKFLIVEDEFCNMFSTMRAYLSRGTMQSFVNVLSENYLLREYMRCNRQMFMANPGAIPSIVPDYAKTERNTLIKLLILMTLRPVTDAEIINELHLVGIETEEPLDTLSKLLKKYTYADSTIFTTRNIRTEIDEYTTKSICQYTISQEVFDIHFADSLKNAYFILEEEQPGEEYIDAKLFNHVTQIILPGQFVTYDGKYYMAKHVSPQSGVVLRRASDLYDGRKYYRQIRDYNLETSAEPIILSLKTVMDIEIAYIQRDFTVNTTGYLEMRDNHDLKSARKVDFTKDPSVGNYTRKYHNKTMMRIRLHETDDKIRYAICLLLSEIFKSVFPDGWPYLAVVTKRPEGMDDMYNYLVHPINGDVDGEYIYVIEDSEIDLGLIETVERNLMKLMEIVTDFLEWHFEKIAEEIDTTIEVVDFAETTTATEAVPVAELTMEQTEVEETLQAEENQKSYRKTCFLTFGYDEIDERLNLEAVLAYLSARTWSNSSLKMARKRDILAKNMLDLNAVNHCDFCGLPLSGVSYEVLNDGRTRCNDCSSSAITTVEELRQLFYQTLDMMGAIYDIKYRVPVAVGMTDARKIAKGYGSVFKPSTDVAPRVVGYAQRRWGKYSLWIENGSPRLATLDTMVHEMTHIWQYLNWDDAEIMKVYKMECAGCTRIARDIVYEGMAMWAAIQYLYQVGETFYAAQQEALAEARQDIYGIGFRLFCEQYPIVKDSSLIMYSPFSTFPPVEAEKVTNAVKMQCQDPNCRC